jgi:hypothetical protein
MEQMISIPESLYLRLVDYFDDRSDADGNSEGFTPNEEMKLLSELEKCAKKPIVEERFYDANGKLCGMSILVESGKLPITGEQYTQWRIEELKKKE